MKSILRTGLVLMCLLPATLKAQNVFLTYGTTVVEYDPSGNLVNQELLPVSSPAGGIAYSGGNLFVSYGSAAAGGSGVVEYTAAGTPVNATLISGLTGTMGGIAISGNDMFVVNYTLGTVGEYDLNGTPINASLIGGLINPGAIAISGNDLYIVNGDGSGVVEFNTSGQPVNAALINGSVAGVAISGNDLFVSGGNAVGEYDLSGNLITSSFITDGNSPTAMTVYGNNLYDVVPGDYVNEYTTLGADVAHPLVRPDPIHGQYSGIAVGPVPEPSTIALLLAGAGAGLIRFRRKV